MAQLSGSLKFGVTKIRRKGGGTIDQVDAVVAASQTINQGDFLILSSGKVAQALTKSGSPSTAVLNGASPALYGIALRGIVTNSSGIEAATGYTTIPVALFSTPDLEFMVGLHNASGASARQADVSIGGAAVYALAIVTGTAVTQWQYMISTTVTNGCIALTEYAAESAGSPPGTPGTESFSFMWGRIISTGRVVA